MLSKISSLIFRSSAKRQARNPVAKRSYTSASVSRLTADWVVSPMSADAAMQGKLTPTRDRSRDLERNNEWARGFLRALENNVIGENGIGLQMRVRDPGKETFDEIANDKIETAWWRWGRVGNCEVTGQHSWRDAQKIIVRRIAADGEIVVRKVPTREGLRIQLIEADLLDEHMNHTATNGNQIRFGVEFNGDRRPVAYHLLGVHPGDIGYYNVAKKTVRVPADQIIHLYIHERTDQTRGMPWLCASMQGMRMLDGYAEAELVAARTGAAKMGFFTSQTPDGWTGEIDGAGDLKMDASPGTIEELPPGVDFKSWDNNHPNSGYGDFVKSRLRGIATSLGISYNTLASDLEGVNFSSIRAGLLEEREVWKAIQRHLIEHLCEPIFTDWLTLELVSGRLVLPYEKMWKFNVPEFQGRRWAWVDPKKDMEAAILGVRSGQTTLRKIAADNGMDIFDIARTQAADNALFAAAGVVLPEIHDVGMVTMPADTGDGSTPNGKADKNGVSSNDQAAAAGEIQSTGMNGAQITALIDLANQVAAGEIPIESAKVIAMQAFPLIPESEINKIFAGMANFKPKPKPEAKPKIDTEE